MQYRAPGYTLIELLTVLAVLALLLTVAAPGMQQWLRWQAVQAAMQALIEDLRFARAEAIARSLRVAVCSSKDGATCNGGADWQSGWIVFADPDGDGQTGVHANEPQSVLRVQQSWPQLAALTASAFNRPQIISYEPAGWARAAARNYRFVPAGANGATGDDGAMRLVCVSSQGRAAARPAGVSSCS